MDESDRQFPAVAFLVHDDEVVGADNARASIEGHALGHDASGIVCETRDEADKEIDAYDQERQQLFEHASNIVTAISSSPGIFATRKGN